MSVVLPSELRFANVAQVLRDIEAAPVSELDLAPVQRIDSAGAALLLELTRLAAAAGRTLALRNANAQVMNLLRFFELDQLLHLASE